MDRKNRTLGDISPLPKYRSFPFVYEFPGPSLRLRTPTPPSVTSSEMPKDSFLNVLLVHLYHTPHLPGLVFGNALLFPRVLGRNWNRVGVCRHTHCDPFSELERGPKSESYYFGLKVQTVLRRSTVYQRNTFTYTRSLTSPHDPSTRDVLPSGGPLFTPTYRSVRTPLFPSYLTPFVNLEKDDTPRGGRRVPKIPDVSFSGYLNLGENRILGVILRLSTLLVPHCLVLTYMFICSN